MVGVLRLQVIEHHIHRILEGLVLLPDLAGIDHIKQHGEVLLLLRRFIPDVADIGLIQELFTLHPKIFRSLFALALGVCDQGIHKL